MTGDATVLTAKKATARVTISDMARALGLTKSTVSRALNGYPDISEATQMRVKRMAEQLNYHPLSHAQAIKTGRTRSLGLVLQLSDHDAQRPFLAEFLAGLSEGASTEDYTLTVASADDHAHLIATFRNLLRDGKADGFILPRAVQNDPRARMLQDAGVPFVLFGRQEEQSACSWYDVRGEDAMHEAVLHLSQLGHRRIGFINGGHAYSYATLREAGFLSGLAHAGLTEDRDLMMSDAVTQEAGCAAAHVLLARNNPPTAIICAIDRAALGVYAAAAERGLAIGKDLSIIAYDGIQEGANVSPPLSTFAVDTRAAGVRLAQLLIRQIQGEAPDTLRETVPATFLDRGSTGPAIT
ncbi:LacI family DNA-binding transcriptional regulator [Marivita hallyeonensis]|uniref:Transcriptional regulator, LacI family n=1 Tax=Marivita hallyeonensis TaxID=996342 RepID=A0A1M5MPV2_9RHOB|nr:LacI family DNA-binding transcriptional regulator [Marivita hallyeonensis]SHG79440.1 transcriptional regulator, LacI family [Marivita hallyeonensis]